MHPSPEQEFVARCAEPYENQEIRQRIEELLARRLDWDYIQEYARFHGLLPFVWLHLRGRAESCEISQNTLKQLSEAYYASVSRSVKLSMALRRILLALNENGIINIPLKGAALFERVYSEAPFRFLGDIDILICREDFKKIGRILTCLGYLQLPLERFTRNYGYSSHFVKSQDRILIDVHWDLFQKPSPFSVDTKTVWKNARNTTICNINTLAMSCEDNVLFLCAKLFEDLLGLRCVRLVPLCDIAQIVRCSKKRMSWDYVLDKAEKWNLALPVHFALRCADMLYDTPVPKEALLELRQHIITKKNLAQLKLLQIVWGKDILRIEKDFPFIDLEDILSKGRHATKYRFLMATFLLLQRPDEKVFWLKKYFLRYFHMR
jgi:hypothetical protein